VRHDWLLLRAAAPEDRRDRDHEAHAPVRVELRREVLPLRRSVWSLADYLGADVDMLDDVRTDMRAGT
jgi:hypothetical protein